MAVARQAASTKSHSCFRPKAMIVNIASRGSDEPHERVVKESELKRDL
jgi:hypothetical protein